MDKLFTYLRGEILHQQDYQNDVWRTHKTMYGINWEGTTVTDSTASKYESRRVADQRRNLTYLQLNTGAIGNLSDKMTFNLSYHQQDELGDRETVKIVVGLEGDSRGSTLFPDNQLIRCNGAVAVDSNDKQS